MYLLIFTDIFFFFSFFIFYYFFFFVFFFCIRSYIDKFLKIMCTLNSSYFSFSLLFSFFYNKVILISQDLILILDSLALVPEEDSLQVVDSDYSDNALENLMRAAQQK